MDTEKQQIHEINKYMNMGDYANLMNNLSLINQRRTKMKELERDKRGPRGPIPKDGGGIKNYPDCGKDWLPK